MSNQEKFVVIEPQYQVESPRLPSGKYARRTWLEYGAGNRFGEQIYNLVRDCTLLKTCIDVTIGELTEDKFLQDVIRSLMLYGAAPLLIKKRAFGRPTMCLLDHRWLRITGDRSKFRYQPYFSAAVTWTNDPNEEESVIYLALDDYNPYPTPFIYASIRAAQCLNGVFTANVSMLENEFSPSVLVNLSNGIPDPETAEEIERDLNRKFCGASNQGRIMVSFSEGKDTAATVETIDVKDFGDRYDRIIKTAQDQILANFRCTATLLGLSDAFNSSFNSEEYYFQYALFTHFTLVPLQQQIINLFQRAGLEVPPMKLIEDTLPALLKNTAIGELDKNTKNTDGIQQSREGVE